MINKFKDVNHIKSVFDTSKNNRASHYHAHIKEVGMVGMNNGEILVPISVNLAYLSFAQIRKIAPEFECTCGLMDVGRGLRLLREGNFCENYDFDDSIIRYYLYNGRFMTYREIEDTYPNVDVYLLPYIERQTVPSCDCDACELNSSRGSDDIFVNSSDYVEEEWGYSFSEMYSPPYRSSFSVNGDDVEKHTLCKCIDNPNFLPPLEKIDLLTKHGYEPVDYVYLDVEGADSRFTHMANYERDNGDFEVYEFDNFYGVGKVWLKDLLEKSIPLDEKFEYNNDNKTMEFHILDDDDDDTNMYSTGIQYILNAPEVRLSSGLPPTVAAKLFGASLNDEIMFLCKEKPKVEVLMKFKFEGEYQNGYGNKWLLLRLVDANRHLLIRHRVDAPHFSKLLIPFNSRRKVKSI